MADATTYFLYARKSTDTEDRQVRSIDAQLTELRTIASRDELTIVDELVEKQSAKQPGRRIFNSMLERIESGEANGILAWHADRLARNSLDGGRIIYLLDTGRIRKLQFFGTSVENTPQGKMMLNAEFGFSKYYVDSLAENTKRGLREKVRRGEFPGVAPLGYLNDYRAKRIIIDRERAPVVKRIFEQYAEGTATIDDLRLFLSKHGIRSKKGKLISRAAIPHKLTNPIYYGHFRWSGEVHEGNHEPIITKKLFDEVQEVLNGRWRTSPKFSPLPPKPFTKLLRCAGCDCAITAERQKGHTYYRCTRKGRATRRCTEPFIREESLDLQISGLLSPFSLPKEKSAELLSLFERDKAQVAKHTKTLLTAKRAKIQTLTERLTRSKDAFLDAVISREDYLAEKATALSKKKSLEEQITSLERSGNYWLEPLHEWILTAQTLGEIANGSLLTEKRDLAKRVFGSNLVLGGKTVSGQAEKPWSHIPETANCPTGVRLYELARTFFHDRP